MESMTSLRRSERASQRPTSSSLRKAWAASWASRLTAARSSCPMEPSAGR